MAEKDQKEDVDATDALDLLEKEASEFTKVRSARLGDIL